MTAIKPLPIEIEQIPFDWVRRQFKFISDIGRGTMASRVRLVQEMLTLSGISLVIDGDFGPATELGVRRFQRNHELPDSGVVDIDTFHQIIMPLLRANAFIQNPDLPLNELIIEYARQHLLEHPREVGGRNHGPWVRMYLRDREEAWCAGFVFYCVNQACLTRGVQPPIRSTFSCDNLAEQARQAQIFITRAEAGKMADRKAELRPGTIFLKRGSATDWIHTGLVEAASSETLDTIEGNTNDDGVREGYEVCRRIRGYANMDFIKIA